MTATISSTIRTSISPSIGSPSDVDPILAADNPDLIVFYPYQNDTTDASPNGRDATAANDTYQAGAVGQEIVFNGTSTSTVMTNHVGAEAICTVSQFVTRTTTGIANLYTYAKTAVSNEYIQHYVSATGVHLDLPVGGSLGNIIKFNVTITQGVRYHIMFVAGATSYACFVDGVEIVSTTITRGTNNGDWGSIIPAGTKKDDVGVLWKSDGPFYASGANDQFRAFDAEYGQTEATILAGET